MLRSELALELDLDLLLELTSFAGSKDCYHRKV